jgi:4-amino-4-deoxy-L-arabinose transferase-like glycosyltransferase
MSRSAIVCAGLAAFVVLGCLFVPYPGIQEDEILFGPPLFPPYHAAYSWNPFGWRIPVMLMSYVGALKSWLSAPVLLAFGPSPWAVRLPALVLAAAAIWCYYRFARHAAGNFAAGVLLALLATDPMFLLATCFDWGPVALQHLLQAAALCLVLRFDRTRSLVSLGAAAFLAGLALWNKAIFGWTLIAVGLAVMFVFPVRLRAHLTPKSVAVATFCILLGAAPLLLYNIENDFITMRENAAHQADGIVTKLPAIRWTFDGSGLFGYLVPLSRPVTEPPAHRWYEHVTATVAAVTGHAERTVFAVLILGACLIPLPLLYRPTRHAAAFCLIVSAFMWIQMASTPSAGASVHHVILMAPWPHLYFGLFLLSLRRRPVGHYVGGVALAMIVFSNLAVLSEYHSRLMQSGGLGAWTNATTVLASKVAALPPDQDIVVVDWGLYNHLVVARRSANHVIQAYRPLRQPLSQTSIAEWRSITGGTPKVYIGFTEGNQIFPETYTALEALTRAAGRKKRPVSVLNATNGVAMIEIFRLEPVTLQKGSE